MFGGKERSVEVRDTKGEWREGDKWEGTKKEEGRREMVWE